MTLRLLAKTAYDKQTTNVNLPLAENEVNCKSNNQSKKC